MDLPEAIDEARRQDHEGGNCTMCAVEGPPDDGRYHRGKYECGNYGACFACHNAPMMERGDICQCCGRMRI